MNDPSSVRGASRPDVVIFVTACALGALAVMLGAFGAHALKAAAATWDAADQRLGWWKTAVDYQFWHALLLLGIARLASTRLSRAGLVAAIAVVAGCVLFCGSLYVMTLTGNPWLGRITPLGGLSFIAAWIAAGVAAVGRGRDAP